MHIYDDTSQMCSIYGGHLSTVDSLIYLKQISDDLSFDTTHKTLWSSTDGQMVKSKWTGSYIGLFYCAFKQCSVVLPTSHILTTYSYSATHFEHCIYFTSTVNLQSPVNIPEQK